MGKNNYRYKRRIALMYNFWYRRRRWKDREPPRWRILAWIRWKSEEPKPPKWLKEQWGHD